MKKLNIGVIAHVDAGKTTLTENILWLNKVIAEKGRVDQGNTQTDSMDIERRRGISVKAAATSFDRNEVKYNLIDTPGHVDFVAEVERSLQVLDGVVLVISAKEGIQSQTRILMDTIMAQKIPAVIFINKIDRLGAEPEKIAAEANEYMGGRLVSVGQIRENGDTCLLEDELLIAGNYEALYSLDDSLMESYVNNKIIPFSYFHERLTHYTKQGQLYPVYFGSALHGIGVELLLDGLPVYLPLAESDNKCPISGVVFKIDNSTREKLAFVRLYKGSLEIRSMLKYQGKEEKITRLSGISNGRLISRPMIEAGDIGILYFKDLRVGDIIGEIDSGLRKFSLGRPTIMSEVMPDNAEHKRALYEALAELADEDPILNLSAEHGLFVQMFGEIQMEILRELLMERYNIAVTFAEAMTIYAETPVSPSIVRAPIYKNDTNFPAGIGFRVEPLPRGSGLRYVREVSFGNLEKPFQNAVEAAVYDTCKNGLYGWEVTDCRIVFDHSGYCSVTSTPAAFRDLAPLVLMEAFMSSGMALLEPVLKFELRVPEEAASKALFDCERMRASVEQLTNMPEFLHIVGIIPAQTCKNYSVQVSSYTGGRGIFITKFHGYQNTAFDQSKVNEKGINLAANRGIYLMHKLGAL